MKLIRSLAVFLLFASGLFTAAYAAEPPEVSAASYVLMDADSGRVLAAEKEREPRLIASTTKIMTALIVLERCDPDKEVEIEPSWTGIEGSTMYLEAGQVMTVRDLLYGLMLASGNDAAVALACVAAGDVDSFAELMNERASELGCEHTHFSNPSGLDAEDHYSCARDLALIAREAIRNDEFRKIASASEAAIGGMTFTNHNRLLRECDGVFGVKTGYTEAAGRTLVTCCERGGVTLLCVTLSDPDDWVDHAALYDWAYDSFRQDDVLRDMSWKLPVLGGEAGSVGVSAEDSLTILRGGDDVVETRILLPSFVWAGVVRGAPAGEIDVFVNGEFAAAARLVYTDTVDRVSDDRTFLDRLLSIADLPERKAYALL